MGSCVGDASHKYIRSQMIASKTKKKRMRRGGGRVVWMRLKWFAKRHIEDTIKIDVQIRFLSILYTIRIAFMHGAQFSAYFHKSRQIQIFRLSLSHLPGVQSHRFCSSHSETGIVVSCCCIVKVLLFSRFQLNLLAHITHI